MNEGFNLGEMLALRAAVNALIATHPDKALLREAIRAGAIGLSSTALQGNQPEGTQARFDRSIEQFLRTTHSDLGND